MNQPTHYRFEWYESFLSIPVSEVEWNSLCDGISHPFFSWSWLRNLEASGSIGPETGWNPCHLLVRDNGIPKAAGVFYQRTTSWGELFFDFGWANAAQQLNIPYYPKMVGTIPATPAKGYNFLYSPNLGELEKVDLENRILDEVERRAWADGMNQVAYLFLDESLKKALEKRQYSAWVHHQFRWTNPGYEDFDQFLGTFTKNQRKNIRKERQSVKNLGIGFRFLTGDRSTDRDWVLMHAYYDKTNRQFGPYAARFLNKKFFELLGDSRPPYISLVQAFDNSTTDPIGMAFLARSRESLFGRYWGTNMEIPFLHFNLCYYAPQEYAIEQRIPYFDPGVGSFHKVRRGFESREVYSAHKFSDPRMTALWEQNIPRINSETINDIEELNNQMPQKQGTKDIVPDR